MMSTSVYEKRIVRPILVKQPSTVVLDLIHNADDPSGIGVVESTGAESYLHPWLKVAAVGIETSTRLPILDMVSD